MNNRFVKLLFPIFCFLVFLLVGCATIPKESVQLSEELTQMIYSAKKSHLDMVDEFIAERRQRVELFIEQKWIPDYMAFFMKESQILKDLEKATTSLEKEQKIMQFTEAATKEISNRRASIMDALLEIEKILKEKIEAHYEDMVMVNQALTAHLRSAAEVTATREELLKQLKVKPEELLPMGKISNTIGKIISFKGKVEELSNIVGEAKSLIKGGK